MSSPLCYSVKCANCGFGNSILRFGYHRLDYDDLDGKPNANRRYTTLEHCTNCNYVSDQINKIELLELSIVNSTSYQSIFIYDKQYPCPATILLEGRAYLLDALGLNLKKSQYLIYLCWEFETASQSLSDYYRNKAVKSIIDLYKELNLLSIDEIWQLNKFLLDSYRRLGRFKEAEKLLDNIRSGMSRDSEHVDYILFQELAISRRDKRNYRTGVLLADWWKIKGDL